MKKYAIAVVPYDMLRSKHDGNGGDVTQLIMGDTDRWIWNAELIMAPVGDKWAVLKSRAINPDAGPIDFLDMVSRVANMFQEDLAEPK